MYFFISAKTDEGAKKNKGSKGILGCGEKRKQYTDDVNKYIT